VNQSNRINHQKADLLLACMEGIDDDILAEAANAVRTRNLHGKSGKKPWFALSNIAAVFVGVLAISGILMMAFWLRGTDSPDTPIGPDYNNGNNGYHITTTPTPQPSVTAYPYEDISEPTMTNETSVRQAVEMQPLPFANWALRYIQLDGSSLTVFYEPFDFATAMETMNWYQNHYNWETDSFEIREFEYLAGNLFDLIHDLQDITISVNATWTEGDQIDTTAYTSRWSTIRGSSEYMLQWYETPPWIRPERNDMGFFEGIRWQHEGAHTGMIVIAGNYLYLDPVELILDTDYERIEELGLPPYDPNLGPKGFRIISHNHNTPQETLRFEITPDTIFQFVDSGLRLPTTHPQHRQHSSNCLESFLHYLQGSSAVDPDMIGAPTMQRIMYFVQVDDSGRVISVSEELAFTQ